VTQPVQPAQPAGAIAVAAATGSNLTKDETRGLVLGFIGVLCFSASLPFTRVAVREFGVIFPTFGRAVIAGVLAAGILGITRTSFPPRHLWPNLLKAGLGVVVGFPAFTGLALQLAPAGHGSVVIGLLPAATAGWSVVRQGSRPSSRYWFFAAIGAGAIIVLTLVRGSSDIALGDLFLLAAVASAAVGYGEGSVVSSAIGGWQTISWIVLCALPLTIPLTIIGLGPVGWDEPWTAWISLAYIGAVSMFLGFFAWYAGLALGGIPRVSPIQLLQPLFSLVWAGVFLHEDLDALIIVVALIVLVSVAGSRKSAVG
jgi:drug/metabolite transporter (DMT)-like permease